MSGKVQGISGNGYFTQAAQGYADGVIQEEKKGNFGGKLAAEYARMEQEKILDEMDHSAVEYRGYGADGMWKGNFFCEDSRNRKDEDAKDKDGQEKQPDILKHISDEVREEAIRKLIGDRNAPYSALADGNGEITYNGVIFQCDYENNRLCLGDVSNPDNCLNIPLEKGGSLVVNRDNIDGLVKAIGMFSPADVRRIMQALAQDAKVRQTELQIEDETSGEQVVEKEDKKTGEIKAPGENDKKPGEEKTPKEHGKTGVVQTLEKEKAESDEKAVQNRKKEGDHESE